MKPARARNSARYHVTLGDQWRQHANPRTDGVVFIGTVQRGMHIGALGQLPDGSYVCGNGRSLRPLVGRKVDRALAGEPPVAPIEQVYPV